MPAQGNRYFFANNGHIHQSGQVLYCRADFISFLAQDVQILPKYFNGQLGLDSGEQFVKGVLNRLSEVQLNAWKRAQIRRQGLDQHPVPYRRNGAVYVVRRDVLLDQRSLYGRRCLPYVMPPERSINIDTELELVCASAVYRHMLGAADE